LRFPFAFFGNFECNGDVTTVSGEFEGTILQCLRLPFHLIGELATTAMVSLSEAMSEKIRAIFPPTQQDEVAEILKNNAATIYRF